MSSAIGLAIAPTAMVVIAPVAVFPIAVVPVITAMVMTPVTVMGTAIVMAAIVIPAPNTHIDAGGLRRRRDNRPTGHQRRRQRETCKKLLHFCSPDYALSHQS